LILGRATFSVIVAMIKNSFVPGETCYRV